MGYSSYHLLNLSFSHLTVWTARVRARYYTNQIQSDCFAYPLKFLLKSSYQKCLNVFLTFSKCSYPQRKPVMTNFKTKKKSLLSVFHSLFKRGIQDFIQIWGFFVVVMWAAGQAWPGTAIKFTVREFSSSETHPNWFLFPTSRLTSRTLPFQSSIPH